MTDFAKAKILFALALVAVLFAIHSAVREFGQAGFSFFGTVLEFRLIYFLMLGLLGCVIYFYAIDFISDNPLGLWHRVGNFFYALTLLFPPVFAIVALSIKVAEGVVWISSSSLAGEISKLALAVIALAVGLLVAKLASGHLNRRDREHVVDRLSYQSKAHLQRAEELMEDGHYDLVALEAFRCIERVLQRALLNDNVHVASSRPNQLIPTASRAGIIQEELVGVFHELRIARNRAIHSCDLFSERDASWFLATTRRLIASVGVARKADEKEEFAVVNDSSEESGQQHTRLEPREKSGVSCPQTSAQGQVADVTGISREERSPLPARQGPSGPE